MNIEAFFKITYGLYFVCSRDGDNFNGHVSNTAFQVTADPPRFVVASHKKNLTTEYIIKSKVFSISILKQDVTLDFLVCLPLGSDYGLNVSCPGYLFYSDHFPLSEIKQKSDPVVRNVPMKKIEAGNVMVLNNIFFETDRYQLMPSSYPEMNKLAGFLQDNPGITIEISGHTDDVGTEEYNLELSAKRAESVANYLAEHGIDRKRMTSVGFGENKPVASNDTEEGKAKNRRTEIKITGAD